MSNNALIDALAEALAPALAKKSATGTPTSYYNHGTNGLFAQQGINQDVIATVVRPTGMLEVLPAYATVYTNPYFAYLTGFRADTGDEPSTACADCVVAGLAKACYQTAQFGRYCRETRELDIERVAELVNRGEETGLRLVNPVLGDVNAFSPSLTRQNFFASEIARAMVEVGVSFERVLGPQIWQGNPANNIGAGYAEFPGLDILIATGKVDAFTNTSCPSLNPDIKDFNYQDVCSGTPSIVHTMTYMARYLKKNASTMGMDPVGWVIAMREELFYELTACWPCSYLSYRCSVTDGANIDPVPSFDTAQAVAMRDAMREGKYLLIDGMRWRVVLDDGIAEDTNVNNANLQPGEFASDIYFIPMTVRSNFQATYLEYFDFSQAQETVNFAGLNNIFKITDAGKFIWNTSWVNNCFLIRGVIRPRIILLTPQLAGRITNVKYTPLQHTRQPFPTDGYFVDGGVYSTTTPPTLYSEWRSQDPT